MKLWKLALCGVLDAMFSLLNFVVLRPDGSLVLRTAVDSRGTLVQMGILALAAGGCAMAAGIWSSRRGHPWFLVLNGFACFALGAILTFWTGPLGFTTVALLIVVMALSLGMYELETARTSRRESVERWLLGAASIGFALVFLAFVFAWIKLDPRSPAQTLHWIGSYFAFSAFCKLGNFLIVRGDHELPHHRAPVGGSSWVRAD